MAHLADDWSRLRKTDQNVALLNYLERRPANLVLLSS